MSMVKKLLSAETCRKCKVCCGFTREDIWEIPLIYTENREAVENKTGARLIPRGSELVFDMSFDGELSYCPALTESGCSLGEHKPFGKTLIITVSPVCESVFSLPLKSLCDFVRADGFSEKLFCEAHKHPDIVKPYIGGYPILAVEE